MSVEAAMTDKPQPKKASERKPSQRLITQNLLASAALFESQERVNWAAIEDLSALIDLFCLYDRAIAIGHKNDKPQSIPQSGLFDLLADFVNFRPPEEEIEAQAFSRSASQHLATFLGDEEDSDRFRLVFEMVFRSAHYDWTATPPDTPDDIEIGRQWLLTAPTHADLVKLLKGENEYAYRGTAFLVRTFLYLAYANVYQIVFTPDTTRGPVLENILAKEEQFRGRLLKRLQEPWKDHQVLDRRVAPFAAIIFKRAYPDKRNIPTEMAKLREELAPLRKRLHDIEDRLLWRSYDEALAAEAQWNNILVEIERDFTEPTLRHASAEIKVRQALNLAGPASDLVDKPVSPGAWAKALLGAPLEAVYRMLRRRPVIEIHRLQRQLPGPLQLEELINNLFGEVRET
jgi:hypothetical protein